MFDRPDTNIGSATFETVHSADLSRDLTKGTVYLRGLDISPEHSGEGNDSETYRDFERHMIRLRVREIIWFRGIQDERNADKRPRALV